ENRAYIAVPARPGTPRREPSVMPAGPGSRPWSPASSRKNGTVSWVITRRTPGGCHSACRMTDTVGDRVELPYEHAPLPGLAPASVPFPAARAGTVRGRGG